MAAAGYCKEKEQVAGKFQCWADILYDNHVVLRQPAKGQSHVEYSRVYDGGYQHDVHKWFKGTHVSRISLGKLSSIGMNARSCVYAVLLDDAV